MIDNIRNTGIRRVRVSEILENEHNFRTHGDDQHAALKAAEDELGWIGYPTVYVTESGALKLVNGHLRKRHLIDRYGADTHIDVNVTDLTDDEARLALLTHDQIAAMSVANESRLRGLLESNYEAVTENLHPLLNKLGEEALEASQKATGQAEEVIEKAAAGVAQDRTHGIELLLTNEQQKLFGELVDAFCQQRGFSDASEVVLELAREAE